MIQKELHDSMEMIMLQRLDNEKDEHEKMMASPKMRSHFELKSDGYPMHVPIRSSMKNCSKNVTSSALHVAAKNGDVDSMKEILSKDSKLLINEEGGDGYMALHVASKAGVTAAISLLLDHGAQIDQRNVRTSETALHLAAKFNKVDVFGLLIENGANITLKDNYGKTALHLAAYYGNQDIIQLLIKHVGVDIDTRDNEKRTPLHDSASCGSVEVAQLLLDSGCNLKACTDNGETPLHIAAAENHAAVVFKFIEQARGNMADEEYEEFIVMKNCQNLDAFHVAAINGNIEVVLGAPIHIDLNEMYPLHRACERGVLMEVKGFVDRRAPLDLKDINGFTPLMRAVASGKEDVVSYLIERGALLQMRNWNFQTLLHIAVEKDQTQILKVLIANGGGNLVNSQDKDYSTPLHYAAASGNVAATKILLELAGSIKNDHNGKGPLHCASEGGHLECVKLLVAAAPDSINSVDKEERSPLALAASEGNREVCTFLIERGAKLNCLLSASNQDFIMVFEALIEDGISAPSGFKGSIVQFSDVEPEINCMKDLLECKNQFIAKKCKDQWLDLISSFKIEVCLLGNKKNRSNEVYKTLEKSISTMDNLITFAPDVAKYALDKSIEDKGSKKLYKFGLIDLHPDKMRLNDYFGPQMMLNFNRQSLLTHVVTLKLLKDKWARLGLGIFLLGLLMYSIFLTLLTTLVIIDKERAMADLLQINIGKHSNATIQPSLTNDLPHQVIPIITLIVCIFLFLKELIRMRYMKMLFFKETTTFLEVTSYICTLFYLFPLLYNQNAHKEEVSKETYIDIYMSNYDWKMQSAAVAILCAWTTLLFYLKKIPAIGMYVWMFEEVIKTVMRVLLGLVILLLGFACAFSALLYNKNFFKTFQWSLIKTVIMTFGEFEYDNTFKDQGDITLAIFVVFLIVMPILFMNLLVGLAVGDIESVRDSAYMRNFKCQVKTLDTLIHTYPKFVLRFLHRDHVIVDPKATNWKERFLEWFVDLEGNNKESTMNDLGVDYTDFEEFDRNRSSSSMGMILEQHYDELFMAAHAEEEETQKTTQRFTHRPFGRHTIKI